MTTPIGYVVYNVFAKVPKIRCDWIRWLEARRHCWLESCRPMCVVDVIRERNSDQICTFVLIKIFRSKVYNDITDDYHDTSGETNQKSTFRLFNVKDLFPSSLLFLSHSSHFWKFTIHTHKRNTNPSNNK